MPFAPGNTLGKGRPKAEKTLTKEKALEYIRERVTNELGPIMDKAIAQAKDGDAASRKDLMDRAYGKPKESLDLSGQVEFISFPKDDTA